IYVDGSQTPTVFNVTAGTGVDVASTDATSTNYLALGLPSTTQRGAVDIDFFAYKPGVIVPSGFNDLLHFVMPPGNQAVLEGETATFSADVAGTPPYQYQWYKNGVPLSDATNAAYTTAPLTATDQNSQFVVVVTNPCGSLTNDPPALLQLLTRPVLTAI